MSFRNMAACSIFGPLSLVRLSNETYLCNTPRVSSRADKMQVAQRSRREELYGPHRSVGRETAKRLQQEDHIKLNVLRGAGIDEYDSSDAFATVSSKSFRAHSGSKLLRSSWDPNAQNASHLQFGSDNPLTPHSSVLKEDFGPKPLTQYKQHLPSGFNVTNIPDMAARYQDNRTVGQSLYNADFDGDKCYGEWSSRLIKDGKKVGRRQKTTLFQKRTHFELGSDPPYLESVTGSSFAAHGTLGKASSVSGDGNGKSSVFRAEDIVSSREEERERFMSVQRRDFLTSTNKKEDIDEANSEGEFTGRNYQTSTHFQFGDSLEPSSSIYNRDFSSEEVKTSRKMLPAHPPSSSKVMHEFPVVASGVTTSRRDFVKHDILTKEKQRLTSLRANKERQSELAVELKTDSQDKIKSVMTMSYAAPPIGTKPATPIDRTPKNYHHLESNRALLHPPVGAYCSEVQGNFTTPLSGPEECMSKRVSSFGERTIRISDNKNTHFVLGFDGTVDQSEKMEEFSSRPPVNPNLPAAGICNIPTKGYSVIEHNVDGMEEGMESVERLQGILQQRNYLKNMNPRDPLNVNLRKAFLEYDKDLSGSVSREEVKQVCKEMGVGVDETDLNAIITSCDKNGTGQIDYHDFALCLSRQHPPQGSLDHAITTTTRKDFKHPEAQRMNHMQQLMLQLNKKKSVPVQLTHFFHLESQGNYLMSTTRKDFTKPEEQ